nr:replication associated protein [Lake Sarah-associated circular molecule 8]
MGSRRQGIFWLLTIPRADWEDPGELPEWASWIRGQAEVGEGGYDHWQVIVAFKTKKSLQACKLLFTNTTHAELSRSAAAADYVWKDDTAVPDTRFEYGAKPIRRNAKVDWEAVWTAAKSGCLDKIPASIRVQSYSSIRRIECDYSRPVPMERQCHIFWGSTGTGKSRRAWAEAGDDAYPKDPRTKFWDGYQGEANVVMDEFRGVIAVGNLLRWLDRYPVRVEVKGSSRVLLCKSMWITSNLPPEQWWPDLDAETFAAFRRRVKVTQFHLPLINEN